MYWSLSKRKLLINELKTVYPKLKLSDEDYFQFGFLIGLAFFVFSILLISAAAKKYF